MTLNRVSVYLKEIKLLEGQMTSYHRLKGKQEFYGPVTIKSNVLQPEQKFSLLASGQVILKTITRDEEGSFFDLSETLSTDKLIAIEVRKFAVVRLLDIEGKEKSAGIVLADLAF